jgi:hypothetical protein
MIPRLSLQALRTLFHFTYGSGGCGDTQTGFLPREKAEKLVIYPDLTISGHTVWVTYRGPDVSDPAEQFAPGTIAPLQNLGLLTALPGGERIFLDGREVLCLSNRAASLYNNGEASLSDEVKPLFRWTAPAEAVQE